MIERLILETICFIFTSKLPFPYVVKIGRAVGGVQCFLMQIHSSDAHPSEQTPDEFCVVPCD